MLRKKWQRVAIAAAGMYVEVVLAALCTLIWWFSEPGFLNHLCLYLIFVCSVSTVLLNVNPLMRFDGYYILADLLEIPNLRQKSSAALRRTIGSWCLGVESCDGPDVPRKQRTLFALYAVASAVYGWVVIAMILWFLAKVLEPYRLAVLGQLLALAAVVGLVAVPLWKLAEIVRVPGFAERVKDTRGYFGRGTAGALAPPRYRSAGDRASRCPASLCRDSRQTHHHSRAARPTSRRRFDSG
jgi:putative peptide zinc metalloprotease protein